MKSTLRATVWVLGLSVAGCTVRTEAPSGGAAEAGVAAPPSIQPATQPATWVSDEAPPGSDTLVATLPSNAPPATSSACPADMVLVEGRYCPEVKQQCLEWMDPPGPYENFRCAKYAKSECLSEARVTLRFCIDRDEYTPQGASLPAVHHSWTSAKQTCEAQSKRLCLESEWQFACEGEEMRPYPYGFERDASACNIDRMDLGKPNTGLRDNRVATGTRPRCVSPFGVRDMSGNVEEWATLDHPTDPHDKSTMKGAWWLPGRNTCRAATTKHGETYEGPQVGVRCCKNL
ncbi:MAG: SUMF1/EgtB/PvdO family nonheme iron enzyme [Myxococcales bacterium]|nr:SUMF1/EgtB/PvdO family nonheme iron enzyme [Myxococcales bacterium]